MPHRPWPIRLLLLLLPVLPWTCAHASTYPRALLPNNIPYTIDIWENDDGLPQKLDWEDWREGEDLFTSAWMRATAPSGNAAYEGVTAWSGELGYGVRAPELGQSAPEDSPTGSTDTAADHDHEYGDAGH